MKICLINNLYEPYGRGGAEQVVKTLAQGLKNAQHEVLVITTAKSTKVDNLAGIKIYYIKPANLFWFGRINEKTALLRLIWHGLDMVNLSGRKQVKEILEQEKPDLVNTHNLKGISYLIPRLLRKMKIRHIHTLHDTQLINPMGLITVGKENNWRQTFFLTKLYGFLNKKLFNSSDKVISPSSWLLDFYKQRGFFPKSKLIHLPNPVSMEKGKEKGENINRRNNFLFIGQLEEHKGILFLANSLKQSDLDFHLSIVGEGRDEKKLRGIIQDDNRFKMVGKVPHDKIGDFLNEAGYLIVPSLCYENSPTVIYEALASNTPVIASKIGGVSELIQENKNGLTFKAGDKDDLLTKIKKALNLELKGELLGDYTVENYLKVFHN